MTAFSIVFLIEHLIYHNMQAAETGHAGHVLKTALYPYAFFRIRWVKSIDDDTLSEELALHCFHNYCKNRNKRADIISVPRGFL